MQNKNNSNFKTYYSRAVQSVFLIAGVLMVSTFPYLIKHFNISALLLMFLMVLVAVLAGLTTAKGYIVLRINVIVAILGFALSSYRAINIFFTSVDEPIEIFAFWAHQLLALIFFFSIYFAIKAVRS